MENITHHDSYETYLLSKGGINIDVYNKAFALMEERKKEGEEKGGNERMKELNFVKNVEDIAEYSGIELSDEAKKIYAIMRGQVSEQKKEENSYMKMGDQQLLAGILFHLGDHEALKKFVRSYPNIFI